MMKKAEDPVIENGINFLPPLAELGYCETGVYLVFHRAAAADGSGFNYNRIP